MCKLHFQSKFDLNVLLPFIAQFTDRFQDKTFKKKNTKLKTRLLRKGTQLINLIVHKDRDFKHNNEILQETFDLLSFRDVLKIQNLTYVLKYTSPCSLASFLGQWKSTLQKGFFPHG